MCNLWIVSGPISQMHLLHPCIEREEREHQGSNCMSVIHLSCWMVRCSGDVRRGGCQGWLGGAGGRRLSGRLGGWIPPHRNFQVCLGILVARRFVDRTPGGTKMKAACMEVLAPAAVSRNLGSRNSPNSVNRGRHVRAFV